MLTALYLLLGLASGGCTWWLAGYRAQLGNHSRAALHAALLGLLLVTLGLLLMAFAPTDSSGIGQMQQMLGHAARHMSLPLLGLAAWQLARGAFWQPVAWGRLVIGLMLGFEVARRLGWQDGWLWLISLVGIGGLATAAFLCRSDKRLAACCLLSCAGLLLPAIITGAAPMAALVENSPTASALLPLFIGAGVGIGLLANQAQNKSEGINPIKQRATPQ